MAASETGRVSLLMIDGPSVGLRVLLPEGKPAFIGRHQKCGVMIDHPLVSRRHCRVTATADGVEIEDLQSNNGVRVNGSKIMAATQLRVSQTFRVGPAEFEVQRWQPGERGGFDRERDDVLDILGFSDDGSDDAFFDDEATNPPAPFPEVPTLRLELGADGSALTVARTVREFATTHGINGDALQEIGIEAASLAENVARLTGVGELVARHESGELFLEVQARFTRRFPG